MTLRTRIGVLIANLCANAVALYGAAGYLADGTRLPLVLAGAAVTAACITALSRPTP